VPVAIAFPNAFRATAFNVVAIAFGSAALHKDHAFQASSPKNFSAGRLTGLFFGRDFPYGKPASQAKTSRIRKSGVEAAGKTGIGAAIGMGVERFGYCSPHFHFPRDRRSTGRRHLAFEGRSSYLD